MFSNLQDENTCFHILHWIIQHLAYFQFCLAYTVTTDNYVYKHKMCIEVKYIQHYLSKEWNFFVVHCLMPCLILT